MTQVSIYVSSKFLHESDKSLVRLHVRKTNQEINNGNNRIRLGSYTFKPLFDQAHFLEYCAIVWRRPLHIQFNIKSS